MEQAKKGAKPAAKKRATEAATKESVLEDKVNKPQEKKAKTGKATDPNVPAAAAAATAAPMAKQPAAAAAKKGAKAAPKGKATAAPAAADEPTPAAAQDTADAPMTDAEAPQVEAPAHKTAAAKKAGAAKSSAAKGAAVGKAKAADKPAAAAAVASDEPATAAAPAAAAKAAAKPAAKPAAASKRKAPEAAKGATSKSATAKAAKAAATAEAEAAAATAADEAEPMETDEAEESAEQDAAAASRAAVGSGRRAAQGVNYKASNSERGSKEDKVVAEEVPVAANEDEALRETAGTGAFSANRRLVHFSVTDENGVVQPLDRVDLISGPLTITGCIYPEAGPLSKPSGRKVEAFGPLTTWALECTPTPPASKHSGAKGKDAGAAAGGANVVLVTPRGRYVASKPLPGYKKVFAGIEEQAVLVLEVLQAIDPAFAGTASASLDEVVARLARAKVGRGYGSAREALLLNGRFVLQQLAAHQARGTGAAADKGKGAAGLTESAFAKGLEAELAKGPVNVGVVTGNGAISIRDVADASEAKAPETAEERMVAADEDMARRMQAKMDAEAYGGGSARGGARGRGSAAGGDAYIRISEEEIADDYPMPKQYEKVEDETDELLLWDEELAQLDPEDLPKRRLTDFSIYNAETFFASLELLPMWSGVDPDTELFASGIVLDDEGDWDLAGGQAATAEQLPSPGDAGAGGSGAAAAEGGAGGADGGAEAAAPGGMRLCLSQIREWVVEFSCDMLFISIRTDAAWYRLDSPAAKYAPWFKVPLKAARLAVKIIGLLEDQKRAARLSFADVVKRLAEQEEGSPTFISKKAERVERFVVVHGQVILNQIRHFPKQAVQRAQFVGELKARMAMRRHNKLYYGKKGAMRSGAVNRNPMKDRTSSRPKPMPATATRMVQSIWQNYFNLAERQAEMEATAAAAAAEAAAAGTAQEVEEDPNEEEQEEEEDDEETALAEAVASPKKRSSAKSGAAAKKAAKAKHTAALQKVSWEGASTGTDAGRTFHAKAKIGALEVAVGDVVALAPDAESDGEEEEEQQEGQEGGPLGLVQCMWQDATGDKRVQLRTMHRGSETVLGDAASECELFVGQEWEEASLPEVVAVVCAKRLAREWDPDLRARHFGEDEALRARNEELRKQGKPLEFFYRHLYKPEEGMFCALPQDLNLGAHVTPPPPPTALASLPNNSGLIKDGVEYPLGSCLFVHPDTFGVGEGAAAEAQAADEAVPEYAQKRGGKHKGSTFGLRAFGVAKLLAVQSKDGKGKGSASGSKDQGVPTKVKLQRFYRPEDVSRAVAYKAGLYDVYAPVESDTEAVQWVDVEEIMGPCAVTAVGAAYDGPLTRFIITNSYNVATSELSAPPADSPAGASAAPTAAKGKGKAAAAGKGKGKAAAGAEAMEVDEPAAAAAAAAKGKGKAPAAAAADKGKGKAAAVPADKGKGPAVPEAAGEAAEAAGAAGAAEPAADGLAMATMDIFAGCGGLSEGMHQAGVADTKWAIEYESPAADAFKLNNEAAEVFCANCNVILRAAMDKAGLADDCMACEDAIQQAAQMAADRIAALPVPGEVEFIMGGPPCQGYSGMNRFNKGNWSMVQNSMVMAFLSFADFYRPRYFLLENVRNFVSHNKSFTFRMTLRTLLDMGYQVRFGVLNAGNYGVPQSRKRTFIWAAAPDERLPQWPRPQHIFRSPQLTINLPGGVQYTAVPQMPGAPLRTVTVKDAIYDLPVIENGESRDMMDYSGPAVSAFQKGIRGSCSQLRDHICKEMNDLNLERCRCIPKNTPGADWRVLQQIVAADPSRKQFKGQDLVPWCLPNTADRHNGWRGLFGRVDLHGHFPTSTTDPQPMGKVGQVFHPEQDRIMSVRECARSQGFPDRFFFSGNVHSRHRQVGNAVPPPLAAALGRQLHKALEETQRERISALLQQQMRR